MTDVIIYTSKGCHQCEMVKDYIKDACLEYIEKDIQSDIEIKKEFTRKGYKTVPVIEINKGVVFGFDKKAIDIILG